MLEVSKGFENFIAGKKTNSNNKDLFDKNVKKAAKSTKQRGSK